MAEASLLIFTLAPLLIAPTLIRMLFRKQRHWVYNIDGLFIMQCQHVQYILEILSRLKLSGEFNNFGIALPAESFNKGEGGPENIFDSQWHSLDLNTFVKVGC